MKRVFERLLDEAKKDLQVGDIVRWTRKFLKQTGQVSDRGRNAEVLSLEKFGGRDAVKIRWNDGYESVQPVINLELDPRNRRKR